MNVIHTIHEFRAWRTGLPASAMTPFVPTMGALHDGHASLVRRARAMADASTPQGTRGAGTGMVLASIFVNPTQFGPAEDFSKYPRTLDADVALLEAAGCDAMFVPSAEEMYPGMPTLNALELARATSVDPGPLAHVLEGAIRPGHFRGVCTVVAKLLNITQPTHLLLGQKDFQQQAVLRQMCVQLNMPVEVITCETLREADGLAMSSRNRYLNADERTRAVALYEALTWAKETYANGERRAHVLDAGMTERLRLRQLDPQYALVAHAETLVPFSESPAAPVTAPAVLLIAAKLGSTRLIDNMLL